METVNRSFNHGLKLVVVSQLLSIIASGVQLQDDDVTSALKSW